MISLGAIKNGRKVYYHDMEKPNSSLDFLPYKNWILLLIANHDQKEWIDQLSKDLMNKQVAYVCGCGSGGSYIDDSFDQESLIRALGDNYQIEEADYEDMPMTTWHNDLQEGIWFALMVADTDEHFLDTVVCLNITKETYLDSVKKVMRGL
ncbi:MAG: hypothetical protein Roseis2KO_18700 [Roseivirga sp.]